MGRRPAADGPAPGGGRGDVRFLLVHHSATSNSYADRDVPALLRNMYAFHTSPAKGWPDIAYNFLVDRFGRIWEGRTGSLRGPVQVDATGGSQGFAQLACFVAGLLAGGVRRRDLRLRGCPLPGIHRWRALASPVVGIDRSSTGSGYRVVAADGGVFCFGDAEFRGRPEPADLGSGRAVAIAAHPRYDGYWVAVTA